jgi:CheY-like chemotaxis protein
MPAGDKVRVLIVDDVADTRENVRKLLQFEGDIDVVGAARTAKEGIELVQELNPDVVLMDINMPDMDGIAATEAIRQRSPQAQVSFCRCRATKLHAPRHACRRAGFPDQASDGGRSDRGREAQWRAGPR